jgi:adenosylhomocysteine nucleosidase
MVNESGPAFEEEFYSEYSYSAAAKYLLAANRVIG